MTIKHGNIENKQHRTVLGNINELTRAQRPKANQRWMAMGPVWSAVDHLPCEEAPLPPPASAPRGLAAQSSQQARRPAGSAQD